MRRRTMAQVSGGIDLDLGDVILYDRDLGKLVQTSDFVGLDKNRYEPVGVVVIPTAHDVYGTGECGVVALMSASLSTPDTGQTSNAEICWGSGISPDLMWDPNWSWDPSWGEKPCTDYPELYDFSRIYRVGIASGSQGNKAVVNNELIEYTSDAAYACLPSDANTSGPLYTRAIDGTYYYYNKSSGYNTWDKCLPSPYLKNGSRNPVYYQTTPPASPDNALSDFDGKANTEFLCSKATAQENWKTDETIINSSDARYHPAACACWRFHTAGTNQGDWYLPACGELGYLYVRQKLISETITALQTWSGKTYCSELFHRSNNWGPHWSSSECYDNGACNMCPDGSLFSGDTYKLIQYLVRPFMRGRFELIQSE